MTWDGWLCWEQTAAGTTTEQSCPDYYHDFDPHGWSKNSPNNSTVNEQGYDLGLQVNRLLVWLDLWPLVRYLN